MSATTSHDPLLEWRREFPTVESTLHFISHSLGAMPRSVDEALRLYAHQWKARGIRAWDEGWFALPTEVGDLLGGIIGAAPGTVTMLENCTSAQNVALSAIDFKAPRNRLVCTAEDFPSVLYLYEGLERRGAEIVRVPARENREIAEDDILAAIDERTAVVAISLVMFRTSQVIDVQRIIERAHAMGALVMLDAYQAVGSIPLDVAAMDVDLLTGGSVKWLCGGPGAGYLYVSPRVARTLEPAVTGWMAHERPFDFDSGPIERHAGPRRFWVGTPGIAAFTCAREGYEIVARIGTAAIRDKSLRQTARMLGHADEYGFRVVSPRAPERRGGTVVFDVPNAQQVCETLLAQDVLLDFRPGVGLRLAPHFYTRDDETDMVMKRVRDEVAKAKH